MFGVSASHWFLWNQFIDASSHGRLDRPLIVSGQTQTRERRTSAASSSFLQQLHQRLKRGKRRVCSPFRQANAPAFRATAHTRTFPEPSGLMIRFVFPKRRSSRRREHCQGGGSGRRGHYLDKRSGAIHSPAANTKQPRQHERSARPQIFARLRFTGVTADCLHEKGRDCAPFLYRNISVESLYGRKLRRLSRQLFRMSSSVTRVFGA